MAGSDNLNFSRWWQIQRFKYAYSYIKFGFVDGLENKNDYSKKINEKSEIYPNNFTEGECNNGRVLYYM